MLIRLLRASPALALLVGLGALGVPRSAQATFQVTLSQTGFGPSVIVDGGPGDIDGLLNGSISVSQDYGTFGDGSGPGVVITATSNKPGNPIPQLGAILTNTQIAVRTGSGGSGTLTVVVDDDPTAGVGFTNPPGSPLVLNSDLAQSFFFAGTGGTGGAQTTLFSNLLSDAGAVAATTTTVATSGQGATGGATSPDVIVARPGAIFDLRQTSTITLGDNGTARFTATTQVVGVPEPSTLAAAFSGLLLAGGSWMRRRRMAA